MRSQVPGLVREEGLGGGGGGKKKKEKKRKKTKKNIFFFGPPPPPRPLQGQGLQAFWLCGLGYLM